MFHFSVPLVKRFCMILFASFFVMSLFMLQNGRAFASTDPLEGLTWANQPAAGTCCASFTVDQFGLLLAGPHNVGAENAGINAWNASPALVWLHGNPTDGNSPFTMDIRSVLGVGWDGITNFSWDSNNHFIRTDITINSAYITNYADGEAQGVVVHELGHALGLAHNSGCVIMVPDTYTRWSVCGISTPQQGDIDAINSMY